MKPFVTLLLICRAALALVTLEQYNIEPGSVTTSGVSSGAGMATQLHVVHSRTVRGAGIFAGVPYSCSLGLLLEATNCMRFPGLVSVNSLISITENRAERGDVDPTSNLASSRVYIFHGTKDSAVDPGSGYNVEQYYQHYTTNVKAVFNLDAQHCYPTDNYGGDCDRLNEPYFLNNCNYSGAYDMLNYLYDGTLVRPTGSETLAPLVEFDQEEFHLSGSAMDSVAYIYVPNGCADKTTPCKLHVAFHGCVTGRQEIGDVFARHAGYLEVAEANNIVVLYPQVIKTLENPQGCYDWWGYTNNDFDTRNGKQIMAVKNMMDRIQYGLKH